MHVQHAMRNVTCQAMKAYKTRLRTFGRELPTDRQEQISETLLLARTTVMEKRLVEAVCMASMDLEEGKRLIQIQIAPANLEKCKIQPLLHLHATIWKASGMVLKGKAVAVK